MPQTYKQHLTKITNYAADLVANNHIKLEKAKQLRFKELEGYYIDIGCTGQLTVLFIIEDGTNTQVAELRYKGNTEKPTVKFTHNAQRRKLEDTRYMTFEASRFSKTMLSRKPGMLYQLQPLRRELKWMQDGPGSYLITSYDLGKVMGLVCLKSNEKGVLGEPKILSVR